LAQFVKVAATLRPGNELSSPSGDFQANSLLDGQEELDKSASIRYHQFQSPNFQNSDLCLNYASQANNAAIDPKNMVSPASLNEPAKATQTAGQRDVRTHKTN